MEDITSKKLASIVARILDDKLGKDITILNISNVSVLADYFVIVTGDSTTQVKSLSYAVRDKIKQLFERIPLRDEKYFQPLCILHNVFFWRVESRHK